MAVRPNTQANKKKVVKAVQKGNLYVASTFNNTLVTLTDEQGNTLAWSSSGNVGFAGSRKSTPYAATMAVEKVVSAAKERSMKEMKVFLKGPGAGRDATLRVLKNTPFHLSVIADITPIAHNGTKPRKQRHG